MYQVATFDISYQNGQFCVFFLSCLAVVYKKGPLPNPKSKVWQATMIWK